MSLFVALLVAVVAVMRTEEEAPPARLLPALIGMQADAAAFQVPLGTGASRAGTAVRSDVRMRTDYDDRGTGGEEKKPLGKRFLQSGRALDKNEFERKSRIVDSANWPPRTMPIKGEGYFFFQGPSPKTAVQEDLPSFFSKENFDDMQIAPQQLGVTVTGLTAAAALAASLVTGNGPDMP